MYYLLCGVKNCRYRHHRRLPKNISLYMLPRDAPVHMKNSWRRVCKGRLIACSEHFDEDDFLMPNNYSGASSSAKGVAKPLYLNFISVVPKIRNRVKDFTRDEDKAQEQVLEKREIIILDSENEDLQLMSQEDPLAPDKTNTQNDGHSREETSNSSSESSAPKSSLGINIERAKALNAMMNPKRNAMGKGTDNKEGDKTPMLLSDLIKYLKPTPDSEPIEQTTKSTKHKERTTLTTAPKTSTSTSSHLVFPNATKRKGEKDPIAAPTLTTTPKTSTSTSSRPVLQNVTKRKAEPDPIVAPTLTTVPKTSTCTSSHSVFSKVSKRKAEADPVEAPSETKKLHVNDQENPNKEASEIVLREVKLARKNFGNVLVTMAQHNALNKKAQAAALNVQSTPQTANQTDQDKIVPMRKMTEVKNEPPEEKQPTASDNLKIVSIKSLRQDNGAKAGSSREAIKITTLEDLRQKHVQKPGQKSQMKSPRFGHIRVVPISKLIKEDILQGAEQLPKIPPASATVSNPTQKIVQPASSELTEPAEEPLEKFSVMTNKKPPGSSGAPDEDDDVIIMPQKIDVIDIDDNSDEEKQQNWAAGKCDPKKCKLLRKIQYAENKLIYLRTLKKKLKAENRVLQTTEEKKISKHTIVKDFIDHLPNILTENQNNIVFGNKRVIWHHSEIQDALILRHLSVDLYTYLREELDYPLPSATSLDSWEAHYPDEALSIKQSAIDYQENQSEESFSDED